MRGRASLYERKSVFHSSCHFIRSPVSLCEALVEGDAVELVTSTYGTMFGPVERVSSGIFLNWPSIYLGLGQSNIPFQTERPSRARVGNMLACDCRRP